MSEAFSQKLINWFISMLLLLLATSITLSVYWLYRAPAIEETRYFSTSSPFVAMMGEALVFFIVMFPPILVWHLFDFAERSKQNTHDRISGFFTSHRVLLLTMGIAQSTAVLIATGIADWNSCDDLPPGSFPFSCRIGLEWWAYFFFFGPLLFSLILCIGKAVISIRSRLTERP